MALTLYNQQGVVRATIAPSDTSTHQCGIMTDNVLSLSFTLFEFLKLEVDDYVTFEGQKFYLLEEYRPEQISTVEYRYSVKFYDIAGKAKNALVRKGNGDDDDEISFSLTGPVSLHAQLMVDNLNRISGTRHWSLGVVIESKNITIDYDNISVLEGCSRIAEGGNTEYWFEGTTLNFSRCEHGAPVELGYRQGLQSLSKTSNENAPFFTRLYPIGSTRNIVKDRYGYSRLRLPGGALCVEQNTHLGIVEYSEEEAFSHIYPRRVGRVSSVRSKDVKDEEGNPYTIWYFKDKDLPFDPNDYEIAALVKGIKFESNQLNGYDFEVNFDSKTQEFEIITQFPGEQMQLPGGHMVPNVGDEYVLYNITMPDEYYSAAEKELKEAVDDYLAKYAIDVAVYKASADYLYFAEYGIDLKPGQRIQLLSDEYFDGGFRDSRVIQITRKVNNPLEMDIEFSYAVKVGRMAALERDIVDIQVAFREQLDKEIFTVVKSWEETPASDTTLYTSRKSEREFLNKRRGGTVEAPVVFGQGLLSDDYRAGAFAGAGFRLGRDAGGDAVAEVDKLVVRKEAVFNELVINQVTFRVGETVFSNGGCEILRVETQASVYRCYYDNKNGRRYSGLVAGDQVRCQRYDADQKTIVKYYWRLVEAVGEDYIDLSRTDADGTGLPEAGDQIAQFGNRTDCGRQSAIVIDPLGGGSVEVLAGIDSFSLAGKNYVGQGVNPVTGRAYSYAYGDVFFGDRDLSDPEATFITYQRREGETRPRVHVQADLTIGAGSTGLHNLTEWGSAQQQITQAGMTAVAAEQQAVEALQSASAVGTQVADMKAFTDQAFADGIVDRAEASAIGKYVNQVTETCRAVDASYAAVYADALLQGAAKSNLQAAKTAFDTAAAALLTSVRTAAADGVATRSEKADVDSKYVLFNTAYGTFTSRLQEADASINTVIHTTAQGAYQLSARLQTVVDTLNGTLIPDLQSQIDGSIMSWEGEAVPSLANYPANGWITDTERKRHTGDYYDRYLTVNGEQVTERYKFSGLNGVYEWTRVADSGAAQALSQAREALGVAGMKVRLIYGDSLPSAPYEVNDIWIKTTGEMRISNANKKDSETGSASDWMLVNDAQVRLRQIASDRIVSKEEKAALRNSLSQYEQQYAAYENDADKYGVPVAGLQEAYSALRNFLLGSIAIDAATDTALTDAQRTSYNTYFAHYDAEAARFQHRVADAIAQRRVDDIEVSARNIVSGSEECTLPASSNEYNFISLPLPYEVSAGETYALSVGSITVLAGTPAKFTAALYDLSPDGGNLSTGTATLTQDQRICVFCVKEGVTGRKARLLLYAGEWGHTAGCSVRYERVMLVRGNKPALAWTEAPEDSLARVQAAQDAAAEALQTAARAQTKLETWGSDDYISPQEKTSLRQMQQDMQAEYADITAQALQYGVLAGAYGAAYEAAVAAFRKYTAPRPEDIAKEADYSHISSYYTQRQAILESIHRTVKKEVETAQSAANAAGQAADAAQQLAAEKSRIFVAQPVPPYAVGDLWAPGETGQLKRCIRTRASGSYSTADWVPAADYYQYIDRQISGIEFSAANLLPGSERITVPATSADYNFVSLPLPYEVSAGETYALGVGAIAVLAGTPAKFTAALYDLSPDGGNLSVGTATLTQDQRTFVFRVKEGVKAQKARLLLYAGEWGHTAGCSVRYERVMLVRGNKPALTWTEAWEDTLARIEAAQTAAENLQYLQQAFAQDQTILSGGLVMGSFLGVKDSQGVVNAGVAGKNFLASKDFMPDDDSCPMIFAGATGAVDANTAPFRLYPTGDVYANKLIAEGQCEFRAGCKVGPFTLEPMAGGMYYSTDTSTVRLGTDRLYIDRYDGNKFGAYVHVGWSAAEGVDEDAVGLLIKSTSANGSGQSFGAVKLSVSDGHCAIGIENGVIKGLRPQVRKLSESTTLTYYDHTIFCDTTSTDIDLLLPGGPRTGQEYEIYKITPGHSLRIYANGHPLRYALNATNATSTLSSYTINSIYSMVKVVYLDGSWHLFELKNVKV